MIILSQHLVPRDILRVVSLLMYFIVRGHTVRCMLAGVVNGACIHRKIDIDRTNVLINILQRKLVHNFRLNFDLLALFNGYHCFYLVSAVIGHVYIYIDFL